MLSPVPPSCHPLRSASVPHSSHLAAPVPLLAGSALLSSVLPQFQADTGQQQQAQHRGGFQNAWVPPLSDMTQHSSAGSQSIPQPSTLAAGARGGKGFWQRVGEQRGASVVGCACTGCGRQETHLDSTHTSNQPSGLSSPANHGIILVGKAL